MSGFSGDHYLELCWWHNWRHFGAQNGVSSYSHSGQIVCCSWFLLWDFGKPGPLPERCKTTGLAKRVIVFLVIVIMRFGRVVFRVALTAADSYDKRPAINNCRGRRGKKNWCFKDSLRNIFDGITFEIFLNWSVRPASDWWLIKKYSTFVTLKGSCW